MNRKKITALLLSSVMAFTPAMPAMAEQSTIIDYVDGTTAVEEAELVFVCRKQYHQTMKPECFDVKENDERWYPDKDYHEMYIAEIVKVLRK